MGRRMKNHISITDGHKCVNIVSTQISNMSLYNSLSNNRIDVLVRMNVHKIVEVSKFILRQWFGHRINNLILCRQ
jgi:hypothetical protein